MPVFPLITSIAQSSGTLSNVKQFFTLSHCSLINRVLFTLISYFVLDSFYCIRLLGFHMKSGNSSVVERNLAKVDVAGPSPVSRSTFVYTATSPSGKAKVCKIFIPGSNPGVASIFSPEWWNW
jgi:hypothetical protein